MAGQTESSTQLNAGTGGDLVRDLVLAVQGVLVKQEVMSIGDPIDPNRIVDVDSDGRIQTQDARLLDVLTRIANELTRVRLVIEGQSVGMSTEGVGDSEMAVDPEYDSQ